MLIEIRNATIKSVTLSTADHGCLSGWLHLDYGGGGQGFGGYALFSPGHSDVTGLWVWRCCEIAGVSDYKDLPGRAIRVKTDHSNVHAIGHFLKDEWFDPAAEFKEFGKGS